MPHGRRFIEAAGITRFHFEPLFPERHVLHHAPDRLLTFTSDKDLGPLIRIAAKIEDNHVLAETLLPRDKYTGRRCGWGGSGRVLRAPVKSLGVDVLYC